MRKDGRDDKIVIIVFSFGSKGTKGNNYLAIAAVTEAQEERASVIITQSDIPNYTGMFEPIFYVEDFMQEGGWHSTLWVANAAKLFCQQKELPLKAMVIAAPMHLRRAIRDVRKVGFEVVRRWPSSPVEKDIWYDKKSSLPWTISWWRWWRREIPLRLLPWCLYEKITLKK